MIFDRARLPNWDPYFYQNFLGFAPLLPFWQDKAPNCPHWPTLQDWQTWRQRIPDLAYRFAAFSPKEDYEERLYHYHEIMMRSGNWHDVMNNLTWCIFPKTKSALFQRMRDANGERDSNLVHQSVLQRSSLQNVLAHFDECGMLICAEERAPLTWLQTGQWKRFFWETQDITARCEPIIFGHGLYEKCLRPYVGLTGKALLIVIPKGFFSLNMSEKLAFLDSHLSESLKTRDFISDPKCLQPFPLLGWPNWDKHNRQEQYYDNPEYFRRQSGRCVPILSYA